MNNMGARRRTTITTIPTAFQQGQNARVGAAQAGLRHAVAPDGMPGATSRLPRQPKRLVFAFSALW